MEHLGTKTLETARLTLRPFAASDAEFMFRNWASDAEVTKYLMWPTHASVEVSEAVLNGWVPQYAGNDYYQWAIVLRDINEPIGSMAVVHKDDKTEMAHIGYCIGKQWWKQGITSEALAAVMRYLFTEVGMSRIESRHDPNNPNSGKVMQSCGMKYEGTHREADWNNHGICDAAMYAILKREYLG
jgi:Acetyltransferases, including N-acetylases of ribosomal proteins